MTILPIAERELRVLARSKSTYRFRLLSAIGAIALYGLLAIFPPLAIPLVIGGVTVGEFWRLVLVLLNTLFFSLTAGLAVSASSRDERRAWSGTTGLVLSLAVLPP